MVGYYKCECGKEFNKPNSFNAHKSNCKIHYEKLNKLKEYEELQQRRKKKRELTKKLHNSSNFHNDNKEYVCCCGKKFNSIQSFRGHKSHCIEHHKIINKPVIRYQNLSQETKDKIRHYGKGEYGRGYYGWKYGIFCQSRYELAYVIYNKEHNIPIERNKKFWLYTYNNVIKRYYPDFIVNGKLIEIKGMKSEVVNIKLKSVNEPIEILYGKDLKYCFDYCKEKYGLKITELQQLFDKKE